MRTGLTGIICAIEKEINPFLQKLDNTSGVKYASLSFLLGNLNGSSVAAVCCGVCKVNAAVAAQVLIDRFENVERIIFSGTAGGIDSSLHIGDTVVVTESVYSGGESGIVKPEVFKSDAGLVEICRAALEKNPPEQAVYYGRTATCDTFIVDEGRAEIIKRFNPLCVDQETAAAAHVCHMNGVPFMAVRSVTDTEKDSGLGSFYANVAVASKNSFEVIEKLLRELSGR